MYRDDYAAAYARLEQVQRDLATAQSQTVQDQQQIALLQSQLYQAQMQLQQLGQHVQQYQQYQLPPRSGTILTLGILSLVLCSIMGPIAWAMGNEELRRIDMGLTNPMGRGSVTAGRVCGIVATVFMIIGVVGFVMLMALASSHRSHY